MKGWVTCSVYPTLVQRATFFLVKVTNFRLAIYNLEFRSGVLIDNCDANLNFCSYQLFASLLQLILWLHKYVLF